MALEAPLLLHEQILDQTELGEQVCNQYEKADIKNQFKHQCILLHVLSSHLLKITVAYFPKGYNKNSSRLPIDVPKAPKRGMYVQNVIRNLN